MNSPRKQRHLLDHDDRIRPSFMTAENVEAMLRGINTNGAGIVQLGVPHGGSGNSVFVDQELLKYDAQTGRFVSSGVVGVLPDAYSVFIPHETGVFYQSGVDPDVTDNVEVLLAEHIYTRPDVNSRWSDVDFTFQTALSDVGPSITGLQLRFGLANGDDDGMEPDTVYYPDQNTNYEAAAGTNAYVTWVARGEVRP